MDEEESKSHFVDSDNNNEDEMDKLDDGEEMNAEWYHESDTAEEIPDPNVQRKALFQKPRTLPTDLSKDHFEEGLLYTMVLDKEHDKALLVMMIETGNLEFIYRVFFVRGSSRQTYHEAGKNRKTKYKNL